MSSQMSSFTFSSSSVTISHLTSSLSSALTSCTSLLSSSNLLFLVSSARWYKAKFYPRCIYGWLSQWSYGAWVIVTLMTRPLSIFSFRTETMFLYLWNFSFSWFLLFLHYKGKNWFFFINSLQLLYIPLSPQIFPLFPSHFILPFPPHLLAEVKI